jgi:hypothetical protein
VIFQGKETGEIYLEAGNMIHAKTPQYEGEKAFFSIMEWREGKVFFESHASPDKKTISTPSAQLLMYWWKKEPDKIREWIPSMNVVFSLCYKETQKARRSAQTSGMYWPCAMGSEPLPRLPRR